MGHILEATDTAGLLRLRFRDPLTFEELVRLPAGLAGGAGWPPRQGVLLDARAVAYRATAEEAWTIAVLHASFASLWRARVAYLVAPDDGLPLREALSRFVPTIPEPGRLRVFHEEPEAMAWLGA